MNGCEIVCDDHPNSCLPTRLFVGITIADKKIKFSLKNLHNFHENVIPKILIIFSSFQILFSVHDVFIQLRSFLLISETFSHLSPNKKTKKLDETGPFCLLY